MMANVRLELEGYTFGRLTVKRRAHVARNGSYSWLCECACGATKEVTGGNLKSGNTTSCGCLPRKNEQYGRSLYRNRSPEYISWRGMKTRCLNVNHGDYKGYGGRGILICDRWLNSFESFLSDMGTRPNGTSLDRIDNNGNYEPGNCRWATPKEQANNRKRCQQN